MRTLLLLVVLLIAPVVAAPLTVDGRVGPIRIDQTTIGQCEAHFGPARRVADAGPYRNRGWHDARAHVALIVGDTDPAWRKEMGWGTTRGVLRLVLETTGRLRADEGLAPSALAPARRSLVLSGPNGIRLGDTRAAVEARCGPGQEQGRNQGLVRCNYYGVRGGRRLLETEPGFLMQVTYEEGRLTRILIFEGS